VNILNIVIVGGGAAGLTIASNIRKNDNESQIIVITKEKNVAYSPCAIPYVIGGHIDNFNDIIMHKPEEYMKRNVRILTETEVKSINKEDSEILYEDKQGIQQNIKYDTLVLATGGRPLIPPINGKDLEGVFKVRTIEDGEKIQNYASTSKKVVLIGGGAIGLELGTELALKDLEVTIVEMMPQLFPRSFDKDMSDKFQEHMKQNNVTILTDSTVESINGTEKVESVTVDGEIIPADMVIMSTGVRPLTDLAESIGCEIGNFAIKTDKHMETSVKGVYAAGDCVEVTGAITGNETFSPLGTTAVRQGIIAARNITGHPIDFQPVLNATVSRINDMEMGSVGLTEQAAEKEGIETIISNIKTLTRARYYPGSKPLYLKLITKLDGTIIGCQMFAKEAVAEKVDTMTAIITQKLTCKDVTALEFSYAPPLSMVIDPIVQAAEDCIQQIDNLPEDKKPKTDDDENKEDENKSINNTEKENTDTNEGGQSFTQYLRDMGLIEE
jgi:NADH oxidase (H2O2-forming)